MQREPMRKSKKYSPYAKISVISERKPNGIKNPISLARVQGDKYPTKKKLTKKTRR